jgi:hypothetical protein
MLTQVSRVRRLHLPGLHAPYTLLVLMLHAQGKDKPRLPTSHSSPSLCKASHTPIPRVHSVQGPGDQHSSTFQQQVEKALSPGGNQAESPTGQVKKGSVAGSLLGILGAGPEAKDAWRTLPGLCGLSPPLGLASPGLL